MKQAIITGATGALGIALLRHLVERDIHATAVVRPGSERSAGLPQSDKIRVVECDLASLSALSDLVPRHFDAFFHLAWNTSSREATNDPLAQSLCISQTLSAVQLAHELGCTVFVGAGSQAEYGRVEGILAGDTPANPETCYGIAKFAAGKLSRKLCDDLGIRHCWARILSMYGPFDRETTAIMYCIQTLLKGERPSLTKAEQVWDFIYSADCARAMCLIAEKGRHGATYPVGSGQGRSLRDYFEAIRDSIDPALPLGIGEKAYAPNQVMRLCADIKELSMDTGFAPQYSFDEGIRETVNWVQKRI